MTALAHLRDLRAATRVLQDMRSAGEHPDAVAYNALLHVCAKAGDGHKALDLLEEMHQYSIPADIKAYNTVLKACVDSGMIDKALWYVDHRETHVYIFNVVDGNGAKGYYFLRKDHATGYKKITNRLLEMYGAAMAGELDRRIQDAEHLADVCTSLHTVLDEDEEHPVPVCELNPCKLDCLNCKGFKGVGICSHVLAINHMLQAINLRREVMEIGQSTYRKHKGGKGGVQTGGNRKKAVPALQRAPAREADSSDEEQERLLELGAKGQ